MTDTWTGVELTPRVLVDGEEMPASWSILEIRTDRAVRTVGRCTLRFTDEDYTVARSGKLVIGAQVTVRATRDERGHDSLPIFVGEVTGAKLRASGQDTAELVVTVEDYAHRLGRDSQVKTYLSMTYADILRQRVTEIEKSASISGASGALQPYVLQADSNLGFVNDLTNRMGLDWIVDGDTFTTWDPTVGRTGTPAPIFNLGESIYDLSTQLTSAAPTTVEVRGAGLFDATVVTGSSTRTASTEDLATTFRLGQARASTVIDTTSNPFTQAEATELATAALRGQGNTLVRGRVWGHPGLEPGRSVTIGNAGPSSGTYYLREVTHVFTEGGYTTEFVAGDHPQGTLRSALGTGSGPSTSSFTHHGTLIGTVTNTTDTEQLGRVKVKFDVLGDAVESDWARVASVGGGKDRGLVATPEVGDEVLLSFEGSDVRRPVVLAGLHTTKHKPTVRSVADSAGAVNTRSLSSRLGHVVELSDGADPSAQYVLLSLAGEKHKLHVGKDRADLVVPAGVPLTISAGTSSITLDGSGTITLKGTEIVLDGQTSISLKAPTIDIAATSKVAVSGSVGAELSGAQVQVKASAMAAISGGVVAIN